MVHRAHARSAGPGRSGRDAVRPAGRCGPRELLATTELAIDTTTQLLSGPSGSGKTTELYRPKGELERKGFHAEIFDVGSYVTNPHRSTSPSSSTPHRTCGRSAASGRRRRSPGGAAPRAGAAPSRLATALRDLFISLDNVAGIQEQRGQLTTGLMKAESGVTRYLLRPTSTCSS
jgi:hypothetical protein